MKKITHVLKSIVVSTILLIGELECASCQDTKHKELSTMEAKEAYKALIGYKLQYISNPRTSSPEYEPSPELFRDAVIQYSKNTNVRKHYEAFFANTPHTLETGSKRNSVFFPSCPV
ncbi:MAG: hypothetical protein ACPG32_11095 [Akkermansiaceae bacterium]